MSIIYALVEPTECKVIHILTIKLLLVISIVFVFFGTPWYKTRLNYIRYRVQGTGYRVQGTGYRVQGTGYRVQGTELVLRHSNSNNTLFQ